MYSELRHEQERSESYIKMIYCANCGERGHIVKECINPLTSFGLIVFKIVESKEDDTEDLDSNLTDIVSSVRSNVCISDNKYPLVKFLMIQRKDTMGYIDFMRGKYPSDRILQKNRLTRSNIRRIYIEEMTNEERDNILNSTFDEIWDNMWVNKNSRPYKNEKSSAYKHYRDYILEARELINKTKAKWFFSEFSFPKGRKQLRENNQKCAQREFQEETGYTDSDYTLIKCKTFDEKFIGTNKIPYSHIYYLARASSDIRKPKVDMCNQVQTGEVKNIGWFTVDQAFSLIRDYDNNKKKVLLEVYEYLVKTNYCNNLNINSNINTTF